MKKARYVKLVFYLLLGVTACLGCRKKEKPEDAERPASAEAVRQEPTPEKVVDVGTSGKVDLRILYAGLPNTERARDFVDFLTKHFKEVKSTDYNSFTEDQSTDFDVTLLDYDGVNTRAPRPKIPRDYAHATITVGVPGADICSGLSLKTAYL
jgi:hypothetical protein